MWQNYIDVIHEYCGEAAIVFDKFHIIRHLMHTIDKVPRMDAKAVSEAGSEVLKGTRYVWVEKSLESD